MYDELIKRLREFASIPEHCENVASCDQCSKESICLSFTNKRIIEVATQAADAIEQLSNAGSAYGRGWTLGYDAGRDDGYDAGRDENMPRWIPVEERLPEKNQIVVAVQRGKTWDYGQFRGLAYLGGNIHKWNWKNNTTKTVDYWMPKKSALPEPPTEEA